jgi:hypothetical protein
MEMQVMAALLGHTSSMTSAGENSLSRVCDSSRSNAFLESSDVINTHFTDSGIFGLNVKGPGSHSKELMDVLLGDLHSLKNTITDEELNRAKNVLKY